MPPQTTRQFVRTLVASRLLSVAEIEACCRSCGRRPRSAGDVARALIAERKLTPFQAEMVCDGHADRLILDDYVLLRRIGAGGMGEVYLAEHRRMERKVAIKVLSRGLTSDESSRIRFHREVKAAARLSHPNIIAAYDAGEANGAQYLVMEYIPGVNLEALVGTHGPLPVRQAIDCVLQAARGLQYAHEHQIIHRDIKPANLIQSAGGVVKILDMGLARVDDSIEATLAKLTQTGAMMGTIDFMSPEQALDTRQADARSDIYSLGCTLYYLLTGRAVYDGNSMLDRLLAHRDAPIPCLAGGRLDASGRLDAVFRRMVAKRARDRYQSVAHVIDALQACLAAPNVRLFETVTLSLAELGFTPAGALA
jgi:serine/threonine protein kinase